MASQIESRLFTRPIRQPAGQGLEMSRTSMPRVIVAVAMLVFLAISLVLLERRLSGAFANTLTGTGYGLWVFLAGLFCIGLKCSVSMVPPRLSQRATTIFGSAVSALLCLFAWAIFPESWSWLTAIATLGWLGALGWFCCSRSAVLLCQIAFASHVWPVVSEFFRAPSTAPAASQAPIINPFRTELKVSNPEQVPAAVPVSEPHALKLAEVSDADETESFLKFAIPELERDEDATADPMESNLGEVQCRMVRRIETNGDDVLEVHATAHFAVGSRQAVLHIPFTPAFEITPQVECEVADGSDVRLKVGAVFPYGARVELKRTGASLDELVVAVDLFAIHADSSQEH